MEAKEQVQREKDALAERLILMYGGGGDAGSQPTPMDPSGMTSGHGSGSHRIDRTQRSMSQQQRLQQQPPHRQRSRPTRSGDVLESRAHVFTATEKDFSPRILNKPKVASRLTQSKHYYRPKPKPPIKPSMLPGEHIPGLPFNCCKLKSPEDVSRNHVTLTFFSCSRHSST